MGGAKGEEKQSCTDKKSVRANQIYRRIRVTQTCNLKLNSDLEGRPAQITRTAWHTRHSHSLTWRVRFHRDMRVLPRVCAAAGWRVYTGITAHAHAFNIPVVACCSVPEPPPTFNFMDPPLDVCLATA